MSKPGLENRLEVMARDKISDLPDSVFEHILSLLPTKQAITTCLLFKRWRHLRLSLPSLDFDESNFHRLDYFLHYIDTVMNMRDDSETLKKFNLLLRSTRSSEQRNKVNTWVNTALHSEIEHVDINDKAFEFKINIPSCIFNCNTITILKLSGVTVAGPPSVDLPSLKVLHLSYLVFPNMKSIYNLIYGCPLLQDLKLKHCGTTKHDLSFPINKGRLQNLVSADVYHQPFALESLSNVTSLRIYTIRNSSLDTFYNLIHLEIRHYSPYMLPRQIFRCLANFPKLETLIIHEFNYTKSLHEYNVPQSVSSHLKEFHLGNYRGLYHEFELARIIMETARVLEIISIRFRDKANSKQEMLERLSSCPKISVNCRLLFK